MTRVDKNTSIANYNLDNTNIMDLTQYISYSHKESTFYITSLLEMLCNLALLQMVGYKSAYKSSQIKWFSSTGSCIRK